MSKRKIIKNPLKRKQKGDSRVFVSSTFEDFRELRTLVYETTRKYGINTRVQLMYPIFGKSDKVVQRCMNAVRECDLLVVLLGERIGWIPEGYGGLSITQLEIEEAIRCNIRIVCYKTMLIPGQTNYAELTAYRELIVKRTGVRGRDFLRNRPEMLEQELRWALSSVVHRKDQIDNDSTT